MSNDRKPKPFKISFKKAFDEIKEKISKITIFKIKENKASRLGHKNGTLQKFKECFYYVKTIKTKWMNLLL